MSTMPERCTVERMRVVSEQELERELSALAGCPRVVAGGNLATPRRLLEIADRALEGYRLFMLAAQGPLSSRREVIFETAFVVPGDARDRLREHAARIGAATPELPALR
jgi:hypothetical protein